jgi:hypothetical protein
MKKMIQKSLIIVIGLLIITPASASEPIDEGLCMGAISMALQLGNKPSDFSTVAKEQIVRISSKYKPIEQKWSNTVDGCFVAGQPMQQIFSCMQNKINDPIAFNYFKGFVAARNGLSNKSAGAAQYEANSLCVTLVK